jgi:hypothetical protein
VFTGGEGVKPSISEGTKVNLKRLQTMPSAGRRKGEELSQLLF